ncbi:MAG: hypothetical protein ABIE74_03035 [Pseudomonadota bacterium]
MKKVRKNNYLVLVVVLIVVLLSGCGSKSSSPTPSTSDETKETTGTGITNTVSSPAEMGIGDIMVIDFVDMEEAAFDFAGVDESSQFIMIVGSLSTSGQGSSIKLNSEGSISVGEDIDPLVKSVVAGDDGYDASSILSSWLRAAEYELSTLDPIEPSVDKGMKSVMKSVGVGDTRDFRVLNSLSSLSNYTTITAELKCIDSHVLLYVDQNATSEMLDDDDIDYLCAEYERATAFEYQLYGEPSDIDDNGKTIALITPQVNRLGGMAGGIITGFFYAADLYSRTESNPVSNEGEVMYLMSPDPEGDFGYPISHNFAINNLLSAVFPHELQHAISYNQHVLVRGGSPESGWLNEGMSHFTEDLVGYNRENPSRFSLYLSGPENVGVVAGSSPNLQERGAAYLFVRFLYEQSSDPEGFLRNLEQSDLSGVDNLEQAFDGPENFSAFSELMARWTIALAMTDRGISSDPRYTYRPRTVNSVTGNWDGVCMICEAEDGRSTELTGPHLNSLNGSSSATVDGSAAKFYEITSVPDVIDLAATVSNGSYAVLIRTN